MRLKLKLIPAGIKAIYTNLFAAKFRIHRLVVFNTSPPIIRVDRAGHVSIRTKPIPFLLSDFPLASMCSVKQIAPSEGLHYLTDSPQYSGSSAIQ